MRDIDSHSVRALLASRALLVKIKRDLENHVRGLLKNLGLVIGRAKFNVFAVRVEELIEGRPELIAAIRPLLEARNRGIPVGRSGFLHPNYGNPDGKPPLDAIRLDIREVLTVYPPVSPCWSDTGQTHEPGCPHG